MKMFRSFTLVILLTVAAFSASAQKNTELDKFYNHFVEVYSVLSQPPLVNYFMNINNTFLVSFSADDPLFINALAEIARQKKISEDAAADSLAQYSLTKLVAEDLWINYNDVLKEYGTAFKAYTDALCPCITERFRPGSDLREMMPILQQCVSVMVSDTAAIANIRMHAGDKTLNEIFRKQQYFSLYVYQNCTVVKETQNETLLSEAYTRYASERSRIKSNRVRKALEYYRDKKQDSLATIFPSYKKNSKELDEALTLLKGSDVKYSSYSRTEENEMTAVVNFFNEKFLLGDLIANFGSNDIYAPIKKISFKKQEVARQTMILPVEEKIEEIKDDVAVPVNQ